MPNPADGAPETQTPPETGYAPVDGLQMYYEVHGSGGTPVGPAARRSVQHRPAVRRAPADLAAGRQVIAADFQGHGRTNDIDRPLTCADLASDVVGLLQHLRVVQADVFGFSVGDGVALHLAIRRLRARPQADRLVGVLPPRRGPFGEQRRGRGADSRYDRRHPDGAKEYRAKSPHPDRLQDLLDKLGNFDQGFTGWSDADIQGIAAPTLITVGCDAVYLNHMVRLPPAARGWMSTATSSGSALPARGVSRHHALLRPGAHRAGARSGAEVPGRTPLPQR